MPSYSPGNGPYSNHDHRVRRTLNPKNVFRILFQKGSTQGYRFLPQDDLMQVKEITFNDSLDLDFRGLD
jgi:hypothetical protein